MYDKANFDFPSVVPSSLPALTASKSINDLFTVKVYRRIFRFKVIMSITAFQCEFFTVSYIRSEVKSILVCLPRPLIQYNLVGK